MIRSISIPTRQHLAEARELIRMHLTPTPLLHVGPNRWLKLESMQPAGSFKVRGGLAALAHAADRPAIVVSSGNHALGVAWASRTLNIPVRIVLAETASPLKIEKLRTMGADITLHGDDYDAAEAYAVALAKRDGLCLISGYNDAWVIAGQSTILPEIDEQLPPDVKDAVTINVPVGGGGLLSGLILAACELGSRPYLFRGCEASASMAMSTAIAAGERIEIEVGETLADGLSGNFEPGSATFDILRDANPPFVSVCERDIRRGMRELFHQYGVIAEGASVTAYIAMQSLPASVPAVAIITGRNIAWPTFRHVIDEG